MPQAQVQKAHFDLIDEYSQLLDREARNRGRFVWAVVFGSIALAFALAYFNSDEASKTARHAMGGQAVVHHM